MNHPRPPRSRALANRSLSPLLCAFTALAFVAAPVLRGQTTPAAAPEKPAAEQSEVVVLPTFTVDSERDYGYRAANSVSATRIATPIADLPFTVSSFTHQFIEDTAATDLYDVVKYSAGVTHAGQQFNSGADVFAIRGFRQAPQRNGFFQSGQGNIYVDPVNIERVEVVKGPAALLYGQVAPGGTVNYITKSAIDSNFVNIGAGIGTDSYYRGTIDANVRVIPGSLFFRLNGSYNNGFSFANIDTKSKTTVISPSATWNITKTLTLKADYQSFYRNENPAAVYPPNMDVATPASIVSVFNGPAYAPAPSEALTNLIGVDAVAGFKDGVNVGFGQPYPALPKYFSYENTSDFRHTHLQAFDVELDATLSDHWIARANYAYNKNDVDFNQTGIGNVYIAPPGSLDYTAATGLWSVNPTWNAQTTAQKTASYYAFAQQILADPKAALQTTNGGVGNPAVIARRPRDQRQYGHAENAQLEFAGTYDLSGVQIKPLVGFSYDANWAYNIIHLNTGSAASPYYRVWDVNPASPTYYINQSPTEIKPAQYTSLNPFTLAFSTNQAAYGMINANFSDSLYLVGGARYTRSLSRTTNFLGTTDAAKYLPTFHSYYTTPQIGLGYKVTKDSLLYASYSTSYTFGGGFLSQPGVVNGVTQAVITGPAGPTTASGSEVGFKTDYWKGKLSSTVSLYHIVQSDGIQTVQTVFPSGTVATSVQGAEVTSNGVEFEVTWTPITNLQVFASYAVDDVRFSQMPLGNQFYVGKHLPLTAKTSGNIWGRYTFLNSGLKGLWIGGGLNYAGKTNGNGANPLLVYPEYVLFNSAVGYDWTWKKHQFSAVVNWNNMTNKFYVPSNQDVGLPARATLTLTARF